MTHMAHADERNIRLLNRHWQWLDAQPKSASATLRALVEEARRDKDGRYRTAQAKEACYFYMRDAAGDRANFEEAVRALFANDGKELQQRIAAWPANVRADVARMLGPAWFDGVQTEAP